MFFVSGSSASLHMMAVAVVVTLFKVVVANECCCGCCWLADTMAMGFGDSGSSGGYVVEILMRWHAKAPKGLIRPLRAL